MKKEIIGLICLSLVVLVGCSQEQKRLDKDNNCDLYFEEAREFNDMVYYKYKDVNEYLILPQAFEGINGGTTCYDYYYSKTGEMKSYTVTLKPCACCGNICISFECDWENRYQIDSPNCK